MVVNEAFVNYFVIHIFSREGRAECVVLISNLMKRKTKAKLGEFFLHLLEIIFSKMSAKLRFYTIVVSFFFFFPVLNLDSIFAFFTFLSLPD